MNCRCGKELVGRQKHYSDACRMKANRAKAKANVSGTSLEHYHENPDMYAERSKPDKLNWGPHMSMSELDSAGLVANRVTIPGDWDYEGKFN